MESTYVAVQVDFQAPCRGPGEGDCPGLWGAVEPNQRPISVIELPIRSINAHVVENDAGLRELENKCR